MDTNIVPVTEAEMTGFFQRVTTSFVSLSRQAAELEEVKANVRGLYEQVASLRGENATLKTERDDAIMASLETENKLNDARRHRDDLESRVNTLNETVIGRDSKVKELDGLLTSARLEISDWQRKNDYQELLIEQLRTDLQLVRERRDHFRDRAERAEKALEEANTKLEAIQKQVQDVFGLVKQVQEVPAAADPSPTGAISSEPSQSNVTTSEAPKPLPGDTPIKPWWETPVNEQKVG
jgi:chromosome segregation ATPase